MSTSTVNVSSTVSMVPVCVYCHQIKNNEQLLVLSDAAGGPIHEKECWDNFLKSPAYKERKAGEEIFQARCKKWAERGKEFNSRRLILQGNYRTLQFDIGDWLVEGCEEGYCSFSEYQKAQEWTGYKVDSLEKFAYVAQRVPRCIRVQLPWAVHQAVAPLNDLQKMEEVLRDASKNHLSVRDVQNLVRLIQKGAEPKTDEPQQRGRISGIDRTALTFMERLDGVLPERTQEAVIASSRMSPDVRQKLLDRVESTLIRLEKVKKLLKGEEVQ